MMTKTGVNTTRAEKRTAGKSLVRKVVRCKSCGRKFEKTCPSDGACEIVHTTCPKCGGELE
jgi:hypothetical protein